MNLTESDKLKLLYSKPLIYKDVCLIYSPQMDTVATIGLDNFYQYISLLLTSKPPAEDREMKKILDKLSDFEYLLMITQMEPERKQMLLRALELFTQDRGTILLDSSAIVLGDPSEKRILDKDNFYEFQSYIGAVCAMEDYTEDRIEFKDTDSPDARRIKIQLIEGRKKREIAKQKQAKNKKDSKVQITDLIASIPIGTNGSYRLIDTQYMTYYAFQDQLKRMGWYEEFNINSQAAMAGAKISKEKLSHWIKNMTFK